MHVCNGPNNFIRGFQTLYPYRSNKNIYRGETSPGNMKNIFDDRAGRRGNNTNPPRQEGNRFLAGYIKEPFRLELLLQRLEGGVQRAFARLFQLAHYDLVCAAALVHAYQPERHDQRAVGQRGP